MAEKILKQVIWCRQEPESIWHIGNGCLAMRKHQCDEDKICKDAKHYDEEKRQSIGREHYKLCKRYTIEIKIKQEDKPAKGEEGKNEH